MLGRVAVRAGRSVPQATLCGRLARVFALDESCLHKNCTCHLRRCALLNEFLTPATLLILFPGVLS